jgi:hypothetical protein
MFVLPARTPRKRTDGDIKKRKQPERTLQKNVAAMLSRYLDPSIPWTAIRHGSYFKDGDFRGKLDKDMGLKRGWPDILIGWHKPIVIELKAAGSLSQEQREIHQLLTLQGWFVHVCRSEAEVIGLLETLGVPMIQSVPPAERAVMRARALVL